MKHYLIYGFSLFLITSLQLYSQAWQPDTSSFFQTQFGGSKERFNIKFKSDGPYGKDWIYGGFWDSDSVRRNVAYRENGEWIPLPFSGYYGNMAYDIEMYGDTLYISGSFGDVRFDGDSNTYISSTGLIKFFNDSIWADAQKISGGYDMSVKGDSIIFWGGSYFDPPQLIFTHFMLST